MSSTPSDTFSYWGAELPYCRDGYNHSGLNERAVEVPIARQFIDACREADRWLPGLEVGNVLANYERPTWTVLDRYEPGPHLAVDLFDHHEAYDWILSVSTLEHVRWDEPDRGRHPDGSVNALAHLHGLLRPGGRMLVTTPFGWNPFWDSMIIDGRLPVKPVRQSTMLRVGGDPVEWCQVRHDAVHKRYAASSIWAEAVWVAEFTA